MTPKSNFILVRGPRHDEDGNRIDLVVSIIRNDGTFDFSSYSFLRMRPASDEYPIEEWVPTKELDIYKNSFRITK